MGNILAASDFNPEKGVTVVSTWAAAPAYSLHLWFDDLPNGKFGRNWPYLHPSFCLKPSSV